MTTLHTAAGVAVKAEPCRITSSAKRSKAPVEIHHYPTAPRHDLIVAAEQLEHAIEQNGHIRANLLLNMAADWLAQTIRDLACSDVSASHTEEFGHTLADVEALVAGARALMVQEGAIPSLNTAIVLIERARDSLATLNEGSEA